MIGIIILLIVVLVISFVLIFYFQMSIVRMLQIKNKINELQKKQNETIANIDSIREKNTKKVTEISIENSNTNNSNTKNEITIPSDLKVENQIIKTEYGDINLTTTDIGVIKNYIESGFLVNDSLRENIPLTGKEGNKFIRNYSLILLILCNALLFLLNKESEIILIGNPNNSHKIRELYLETIKQEIIPLI